MLNRLLKEKLYTLENELTIKDYRVENLNITIDNDFVYIELLLKIGSEYINKVIRIKDMLPISEYDNESVYSNIKATILHIIEYEYKKQLAYVLNE